MNVPRQATGPRRVFHLLDAVRGIAALIVVQRHSVDLFGIQQWPATFLVVDLFFVLSGFVIAHSYEAKLLSGERWGHFMALRLIRLYPLYAIGLLLGTSALIGHQMQMPGHHADAGLIAEAVFSATLMLPNWGLPAIIGPRWSLTYELVANAAYAATVRWLREGVLLAICATCGVAIIMLAVRLNTIDRGWDYDQASIALARVGYSFFMGVLLYRLHSGQASRVTIVASVALGAALSVLAFSMTRVSLAGQLGLIVAGFPVLTFIAAIPDIKGQAAKLCGFLGVTSYAVYVLHEPGALLFEAAARRIVGPGVPIAPAAGFAFLVLLVAGCWLIDRWYDQPVRRRLVARLRRDRRPDVVVGIPA